MVMTSSGVQMDWFVQARYGMFIHYGLYSILGRGEWVMNRERLTRDEMQALARQFKPDRFDADAICDLAVAGGMRYVNLTTMHHDGFRLYDTRLSDFNSMKVCGRDLVAELVTAARKRGLRVALYHSLNNWLDKPDGCDALESRQAYDTFIANTHARIRELVTRFNPIDVMWYDGWWPFHMEGWQGEKLDAMVRSIQPQILINGRHGGPGDFATPEQHMTAPRPWRPWEGCMTLNDHWGFHVGDQHWKTPDKVVRLLTTAACGRGNLLLNIGPRGDGSVPEESVRIIQDVGRWLKRCGECVTDTDLFTWDLQHREGHESDWMTCGPLTRKGRTLYQLVMYWPGSQITLAGLNTQVERVTLLGEGGPRPVTFKQTGERVDVTGMPVQSPDSVCPVLKLECRDVPVVTLGGGMRVPKAPHATYDPAPSDIGPAGSVV
jgi:alpha-L-fucosidase